MEVKKNEIYKYTWKSFIAKQIDSRNGISITIGSRDSEHFTPDNICL